VRGIAYSPDGKLLATAGEEGKVMVWDVATGQSVRTFTAGKLPLLCLAFGPDGQTVVTGAGDWKQVVPGEVRVWDVATGQERANLEGHTRHVTDVAFSPNGRTMVTTSGDGLILVWDAETRKLRRSLKVPAPGRSHRFSPDGRYLAVGVWMRDQPVTEQSNNVAVRVFDTSTWEEVFDFRGHHGMIFAVTIAPDGQTLATASKDGTVKLWDMPVRQEARR
jgi:dipeptidyl aminopeptidase/acylaminoacyl peptidase